MICLCVPILLCFLGQLAPCGLRGCKNGPAPFPGRMSYKATKPGLVFVLYLSMFIIVLWGESTKYRSKMYLCRCVHPVSLTEYSITIQVGDRRGGLLALDNLSTNQGRYSATIPPIAPPVVPTSLHRYTYRPTQLWIAVYLTSHNPVDGLWKWRATVTDGNDVQWIQ